MLIKDFREPNNCFGDLAPGDVFAVNDNFYMVIEPVEAKGLNLKLNIVNLDTGELSHYFDTDAIQLVEAELCVKG